jgi:hypothetical protein
MIKPWAGCGRQNKAEALYLLTGHEPRHRKKPDVGSSDAYGDPLRQGISKEWADSIQRIEARGPTKESEGRPELKDTGYPISTVELSLHRLRMIERGEVDKEALHRMPNMAAAARFAKAVLEAKLQVNDQKRAAEKMVQVAKYGEATIEQTIQEFQPVRKASDPGSAGHFEYQLKKATRQINEAVRTLTSLDKLNQPPFFGGAPTDEDISEEARLSFNKALDALAPRSKIVGEQLERSSEHEKVIFPERADKEKQAR